MKTLVHNSTTADTNNNLTVQNNKQHCKNKKKKKNKKSFDYILKQIMKSKSSNTEKDKQKILNATGGANFSKVEKI